MFYLYRLMVAITFQNWKKLKNKLENKLENNLENSLENKLKRTKRVFQ